jgi:rRNA maturation protein Nop10
MKVGTHSSWTLADTSVVGGTRCSLPIPARFAPSLPAHAIATRLTPT